MAEVQEDKNTPDDKVEQSKPLLDKWLTSIKNHSIIAALLLICMVIIGIGSLTDALNKVVSLFIPPNQIPPVIRPLKPPIDDRTPDQILPNSPLTLKRLLEGQSDNQASRILEIVISNSSDEQIILKDFLIKWRYYHGFLSAVAQGATLKPVAQYLIKLPIDTANKDWNSRVDPIYPPIVLPPRNESGPSLATFQLQLHYYFSGGLNYHSCDDWNIIFDIALRADKSGELSIFSQERWRH